MTSDEVAVLLIEDNSTDALLPSENLRVATDVTFRIDHVESLSEALQKIETGIYDILLLDLNLPDSTGLATLREIQISSCKAPIVVLTGVDDLSLALESLQSGAADYIIKTNFNPDAICRSLLFAIERKRYQTSIEVQLAVTRCLTSSGSTDESLKEVIRSICSWLDCEFGAFWELEPDEQSFFCHFQIPVKGEPSDKCKDESVQCPPEKERVFLERIRNHLIFTQSDITGRRHQNARHDDIEEDESSDSLCFTVASGRRIYGVVELGGHKLKRTEQRVHSLLDGFGAQLGQFVARAEAEKSQAFLATIVKNCDDAVAALTPDCVFTHWNAAAERLYGYSSEEALGTNMIDLVPEEEKSRTLFLMERIKRGERVDHFETVRIRKDKQQINVSITYSPVFDSAGEVFAISAVARDITRQKLAEHLEELATSQMVQNAPVGIAKLSKELKIAQTNPRFDALCRIDSSNRSEDVFTILPILPKAEILDALTDHRPFQLIGAKVTRGSSDSPDFFDITIWPTTSHGDLLGAVIHVEDTTAQHRLEQQRDDFIASIAHDIKNPLVGAQRVLESLCEPGKDAITVHEKVLNSLKESNKNLLTLLQNLIDVYRFDTLEFPCNFELVDLNELLNSCAKQMSAYSQLQNVELNLQISEGLTVEADQIGLRRVMMNLIHNGIKFTHPGGTVTVGAWKHDENVSITVSDTGIGISEEEKQRIFCRYTQGRKGQEYPGGSGLGLYLSKQIVLAHNGAIDFRSEAEKGTKFRITLPLRQTISINGRQACVQKAV